MTKTQLVRKAVDALIERARREINDGLFPSCQLALGLNGEVVEQVTLGEHLGDDSRYVIDDARLLGVGHVPWGAPERVIQEAAAAIDGG